MDGDITGSLLIVNIPIENTYFYNRIFRQYECHGSSRKVEQTESILFRSSSIMPGPNRKSGDVGLGVALSTS